VEINRARQHAYPNYPGRHATDTDGDGTLDPMPGQCLPSSATCTWEEEAANFANWYTYYRTRLFSAIAVTAQGLSNLEGGRDQIRLGYGSINYFPDGRNPYAPPPRLPNTMTLDGQPSVGHIVRGVRFFTEVDPPPAPGSDNRRQEVFDWLFSLRGIGNTPNREALDAIGRYFKRDDDRGPWIQPNAARRSGGTVPGDGWSSSELAEDQVSCRRNFTIFITDGEWTRPNAASNAQPLIESRAGTGSDLDAFMTSGPTYSGPGVADYTYVPANQPQFTTNGSSAGGTLTDVAMQYWSRDLRTDLDNNVPVVAHSASSQGNPAFWQHLTPYLIGYGISASMDSDDTARNTIIASAAGTPTAITWPPVRLENRTGSPPETDTIITDRDRALAAGDIDCGYDAVTNPSGCGRVNDTMRAALAARGDFLSAANVSLLAQGIANAFSAIQEIDGSATSVGGRSATFQVDDRIYLASFRTGRWTGRIDSFNAAAWNAAAINGTPEPTTAPDRVTSNFPAPDSRSIFTSTALTTPVAFPTDASDFTNLLAAQRTALNNNVSIVRWLRGDQTTEAQNGGSFRNRPTGEVMGSIINSTPLYSKAPDFGYSASRRPAGDTAASANAYRQFVADNRNYRPATIFVGSNGGMLHAFDASGSPVATLPGPTPNPNYNANYMRERFAYIPRAMYPRLAELTAQGYTHRYFVDGQVVDGDVYMASRGGWRSVIVGTSGAGPKSIFALDVTMRSGATPTAFAASDVLFDIDVATSTDPNAQYVGHIMGPGVVASVPTESGKWYYLVGNGYESASDKARLLAIDMSTGAITAIGPSTNDDGGSLPSDTDRANRPNGLGAVTPMYDANRNVVAVYAGDRLGRLWKFDLSAGLSAATATMLFDTADNPVATLDSQPITAAPRITAHPLGGRIIVFGTGRFTERADPASTAVQSVYAIREENPSAPARVTWTGTKSIYTGLSLTEQTVGTGPSARRFRILDGTAGLNWASHSGWYFNLRIGTNNTGERVIVTPIENFGFMNISSYEPVAGGDPCKGGGASFFYRLDIAGSFTRVPFTETGLVGSLPITVPRTTVVGVDMPPMIGAPTLMTGGSPTTSTAGSSLTNTQLGALPRQRATATDPCSTMRAVNRSTLNAPVAGLPITCAVPPLRVWRDLPRGPR
jgi:type IV pilus assembly protein PilY1